MKRKHCMALAVVGALFLGGAGNVARAEHASESGLHVDEGVVKAEAALKAAQEQLVKAKADAARAAEKAAAEKAAAEKAAAAAPVHHHHDEAGAAEPVHHHHDEAAAAPAAGSSDHATARALSEMSQKLDAILGKLSRVSEKLDAGGQASFAHHAAEAEGSHGRADKGDNAALNAIVKRLDALDRRIEAVEQKATAGAKAH